MVGIRPHAGAGSSGRRDALARSRLSVNFGGDAVEVFSGEVSQADVAWQLLAEQPVGRSYVCHGLLAVGPVVQPVKG